MGKWWAVPNRGSTTDTADRQSGLLAVDAGDDHALCKTLLHDMQRSKLVCGAHSTAAHSAGHCQLAVLLTTHKWFTTLSAVAEASDNCMPPRDQVALSCTTTAATAPACMHKQQVALASQQTSLRASICPIGCSQLGQQLTGFTAEHGRVCGLLKGPMKRQHDIAAAAAAAALQGPLPLWRSDHQVVPWQLLHAPPVGGMPPHDEQRRTYTTCFGLSPVPAKTSADAQPAVTSISLAPCRRRRHDALQDTSPENPSGTGHSNGLYHRLSHRHMGVHQEGAGALELFCPVAGLF
jgi:hypothetical protein